MAHVFNYFFFLLEDFFVAFFTALTAFFLVFFEAKTRKRIKRIKTATPMRMIAHNGSGRLSKKDEDLTVIL